MYTNQGTQGQGSVIGCKEFTELRQQCCLFHKQAQERSPASSILEIVRQLSMNKRFGETRCARKGWRVSREIADICACTISCQNNKIKMCQSLCLERFYRQYMYRRVFLQEMQDGQIWRYLGRSCMEIVNKKQVQKAIVRGYSCLIARSLTMPVNQQIRHRDSLWCQIRQIQNLREKEAFRAYRETMKVPRIPVY